MIAGMTMLYLEGDIIWLGVYLALTLKVLVTTIDAQ